MTDADKLKFCRGCRNNFYNGNNPYSIQRCWSLATATVVSRKKVHVDQRPPWNQPAIKTLSCYHEERHVMVGPNQTC